MTTSSLFDLFEMDSASETQGIWIDFGDQRVRVASASESNARYAKTLEDKCAPYRRAIAMGRMDPDQQTKILREVYVATIIKGWEYKDGEDEEGNEIWKSGIRFKDGTIQPVTADNMMRMLKMLPKLFTALVQEASNDSNYRAEILDTESGN